MLFLTAPDLDAHAARVDRLLADHLPLDIDGYPTSFGPPDATGVRLMQPLERGPVAHRVEIDTVERFLTRYIGLPSWETLTPVDWLTIPQQKLRTLASCAVFHDGLNVLEPMRRALAWYPDEIWRVLLAAQWRRIEQEEPFPGRCAETGDDLGSRVVTARLVRDLMRLAFLMERTYAPYSKWFGTGFSRLRCAPDLAPHLTGALSADRWEAREASLVAAYRIVARMHNDLALTDPLPTEPSPFFDRPFLVIHGDRFAAALAATVDSGLKEDATSVGAIDQWVDSTDVLSYTERSRRAAAMYRPPTPS
jgi:hypothetical protein